MAFLAQKLISASGPKEETDPDFNLVTHLYQFDGSNGAQNNTFTGIGPSGASQAWTRNNTPSQGTFSPFSSEEGKWSIEFDGSVYCSSATSDDFEFGTGDYTIEAWVWKDTTGQQHVYDGRWPDNSERILLYVNSSDKLAANIDGSDKGAATSDFPLNQWVHIALTRSGTTGYLFQNGSQVATWTGDSVDIEKPPYSIFIGRDSYGANYYWKGFMSNIRVLKGTAAYTGSSYSVPTSPLTAITNTKLLTARMNRFIDSSASAHVMTNNGIAVTPFSPFAPSAEYDAAVNGGSGSFTRSNQDYINATSSNHAIGTSDFTIECWCYLTDGANSGGNGLFSQPSGYGGPALGQWNNTGWQIYHANTETNISDSGFRQYEWIHVAYVRASNVVNVYQNGVKITSDISDSTNYTNTTFHIGYYYTSVYAWDGYISNFKMSLNAIYTSNFTPPTALLTPTSGGSSAASTKILIDFTNAAMFDQTGKTNIETVGNAQLNTSIKKFGTASAKFDESGDYLITRHVPYLYGGDFTIEGFVYFNSSPTDGQGLFVYDSQSLGNRAGYGPALGTYAHAPYDGKWHSYYGTQASAGTGTQGNSEATPSATTWIHFAYVRTSGVIKIFIDGSQIGSDIAWTNSYVANDVLTIGGYYSTSYLLNGYIDSYRVTRKARYTSNFTAPTEAFLNR